MSAVVEKKATAKARKAPSTASEAAPANNRTAYIDSLLCPVAKQIAKTLCPITESWAWETVPSGYELIDTAYSLLYDLGRAAEEWAQSGEARPLTGRMIDNCATALAQAVLDLEADTEGDPAARRVALLLVRDTQAQHHQMKRAYGNACLGSDAALVSLAQGAGMSPPPPPSTHLTKDTPITEDRGAADNLLVQGTYEIEALATEITCLGNEAVADGNNRFASLLRCYGLRVKKLNSLLMSHLGGEDLPMGHVHHVIFGSSKAFDPEEYSRV